MGFITQHARCSGTYKSLWISFYMVGNFKEIHPDFITLIFSVLDISKGHEEALRKQAQ